MLGTLACLLSPYYINYKTNTGCPSINVNEYFAYSAVKSQELFYYGPVSAISPHGFTFRCVFYYIFVCFLPFIT